MSQSQARIEPPGWIQRRLGVSWAELWIPEVTRREAPVEGRLRIQPLDAKDRTLTVQYHLQVNGDRRHEGSSSSHSGEFVRQEVRLEGGWRVEIPFTASFPPFHEDTWYGSVKASIHGAWPWDEATVEMPFILTPPPAHAALVECVGEKTGFEDEEWSVSTTAGSLTYIAKLLRRGVPHPRLSAVALELSENSGQVHAHLSVAEGALTGGRWPRRSRLSLCFPADAEVPDLPELREFLRPYDLRLRSMPIPDRASNQEAPSVLPLPADGSEADHQNLPAPSGGADGK